MDEDKVLNVLNSLRTSGMYLHKNIRQYCKEEFKDILCPQVESERATAAITGNYQKCKMSIDFTVYAKFNLFCVSIFLFYHYLGYLIFLVLLLGYIVSRIFFV